MLASRKGHTYCVKEMLKVGPDLSITDKEGHAALMLTALEGHVECLKKLIAAGADINKQSKHYESPLFASGVCLSILKFQVNSHKLGVQAPQHFEFEWAIALLKCENLPRTNFTISGA